MKKIMYAIKDTKAGFLSPMIDSNDMTAARNFEYACKNNDVMAFCPSDFELYRLGEFDDESGKMIALDAPEFICNGIKFRKVEKDG